MVEAPLGVGKRRTMVVVRNEEGIARKGEFIYGGGIWSWLASVSIVGLRSARWLP